VFRIVRLRIIAFLASSRERNDDADDTFQDVRADLIILSRVRNDIAPGLRFVASRLRMVSVTALDHRSLAVFDSRKPGREDSVFWDSLQAADRTTKESIQVCKRSHRKNLHGAHPCGYGPLPS